VSSIARAVVIPADRFYHVAAAALPRRRLFRKPTDEFEHVLASETRAHIEFPHSGFVLATVLSYRRMPASTS